MPRKIQLRPSQVAVLAVMQARFPYGCTDEQLTEAYEQCFNGGFVRIRLAPSGVRSRRAELERAGFVRSMAYKRRLKTGGLGRVRRAM